MEKKSKTPLVYGYAICLVAVITFLISIAGIIFAVMDLDDPLYAGRRSGKTSLASFENYKMDMLSSPDEKQAWVPDDETLKAMYESEKDDVIRRVRHDSMRSLYIDAVLIIICIVLFLTHWRWMRRLGRKYNTA